jgi:hypothetical protein
MSTKPFNIRLPLWAVAYIERRAHERGTTKTEVILEALERLRADEVAEMMRQGYSEMRDLDVRLAEEGMSMSGSTEAPA